MRLGEAALTFAAGSIRLKTPQDGIVNAITGDNQTTGNRMLLGTGDSFYLKLNHTGDVSVGDHYTVFRRVHKVFHPATGQYLGYVVNMLGIVRVVQVDHELMTVATVRSYGQISPGDPVVRFSALTQAEPAGESRASGSVHGLVVDLQSDKNMTLIARWNVVYLDRGREDGLRPGDFLEVFRVSFGLPRRVVGELKVLSTEEHTATALVSRATSQILRGDQFTSEMSGQRMLRSEDSGTDMNMTEIRDDAATGQRPKQEAVKAATGFTVQQVGRQTHINLDELVDRVEYESGEVTPKPQSYKVLDQIVEYLKTWANDKFIRVEGHADNVEIGPSLKSRYPTNWELSKARATGVIRYLVEKGGLDSAKLTALGYGDTKPVAQNVTDEGRAKNRRVEIVFTSSDQAQPPDTVSQPANQAEPAVNLSRAGSPAAPESSVPSPPTANETPDSAAVSPLTPADVERQKPDTAPEAVVETPVPQIDQK